MTNPLWRQRVAHWRKADPDRFEDFEERAALIYDGCQGEGVTREEAERRAYEIVSGLTPPCPYPT